MLKIASISDMKPMSSAVAHDSQTDVTHDDPVLTGKIALAHMKEFPDYYERLERMEEDATRDWASKTS